MAAATPLGADPSRVVLSCLPPSVMAAESSSSAAAAVERVGTQHCLTGAEGGEFHVSRGVRVSESECVRLCDHVCEAL
jgi:hypothetical protein